MPDELLDLVDEHDRVIGTLMKSEAHAPGKIIRISHVILFNAKGEMALQLRSKNVRFAPGHWVTTGSGHVGSGETYQQAGARELQEEVGVTVPLTFEGTEFYTDDFNHTHEWLGVLHGTYGGNFTVDPEAVERVGWFSLDAIKKMIADGEKIHPELLFLLQKRYF